MRGLIYGGPDYGDHANDEILKMAMIETKEALENLDQIMSTPGLDGVYIGPADLRHFSCTSMIMGTEAKTALQPICNGDNTQLNNINSGFN